MGWVGGCALFDAVRGWGWMGGWWVAKCECTMQVVARMGGLRDVERERVSGGKAGGCR